MTVDRTVLDLLVERIAGALEYNTNAVVQPRALLWPDESEQWRPIVARVAELLPVVTLGAYDPAQRRGPAYWLRCVIAGTIDANLPLGAPIVYLPGVARSELRAIESCPPQLAPIAELQYRASEFTQPKSRRDWTVRSFLANVSHGLGLNIAEGGSTTNALLHALDQFLEEPYDRVATLYLDATYFNQLVSPDPTSMLLGWLDDPAGYQGRIDEGRWMAFEQQCASDLGFKPSSEGPVTAARKLGDRSGKWRGIWKRYSEMPDRYPGIVQRMRQAKPMELSFEYNAAWPQDTEAAEDQLRNRLYDCRTLTAYGARKEVTRLDAEHAWRRGTVWASLGMAPLAFAVEQLGLLAERTAVESTGSGLDELTMDYVERGWRADDAALRALAAASTARDRAAVAEAVTAMYRPWLDEGATRYQAAIAGVGRPKTYTAGPAASTGTGTITMFVDGLRLDVAHRVLQRLVTGPQDATLSTSLAALPTMTETSKAALVPVAPGALASGPGLSPVNAVTGTRASIQVLRALMASVDVQILGPTDTGQPSGTAWTEAGEVDHRGHDVGARLIDYLDEEVDRLVARIRELLESGWKQVDVITDHGWILLPGGLEKVELPAATTDTKKGRCARLKEGAVVDVPTVPWFWDPDVRIAIAPGATCFESGKAYEHGGLSPQECIVPRLNVTASATAAPTAGPEILKVTWLGLLCRIALAGTNVDAIVDLRAMAADASTSIAERHKETSGAEKVSLLVPDEELLGQRAYLVIVGLGGLVTAQREVVVGKNR